MNWFVSIFFFWRMQWMTTDYGFCQSWRKIVWIALKFIMMAVNFRQKLYQTFHLCSQYTYECNFVTRCKFLGKVLETLKLLAYLLLVCFGEVRLRLEYYIWLVGGLSSSELTTWHKSKFKWMIRHAIYTVSVGLEMPSCKILVHQHSTRYEVLIFLHVTATIKHTFCAIC